MLINEHRVGPMIISMRPASEIQDGDFIGLEDKHLLQNHPPGWYFVARSRDGILGQYLDIDGGDEDRQFFTTIPPGEKVIVARAKNT